MTILVTGGAGFIGSNFILGWSAHSNQKVINLDKLTYAGNLQNLASLDGDGGDVEQVTRLLAKHRPRAVLNLAAESHVQRQYGT